MVNVAADVSSSYQCPPGGIMGGSSPSFVKFAVRLLFLSIITVTGLVVPEAAPDHPENVYPGFAVAVTSTASSTEYDVLFGDFVTSPPAVGFAVAVRVYVVPPPSPPVFGGPIGAGSFSHPVKSMSPAVAAAAAAIKIVLRFTATPL
jgi:hypothetical protein